MEKNINQTWGVGDTIFCICILFCILMPVISSINKSNEIDILNNVIELKQQKIDVMEQCISRKDTIISIQDRIIDKCINRY